ncbi:MULTISPECIES: DUF1827 family protein [unclassified Granulicatella]|uniref:DUF1827 family protein n=1 Tax=unclassified Granulicatella TaxID=2630493 RepID=UPI001072FE35|nr:MULTISPECIES: DUF1827 family protein [unclassified Granulicatella]MBF0779858.1 DUF1827 family protein [Granulicatella sp. 19428wC4_WM01]TFU96062.1 DUF1827 family protein [Granulicatella sp. WM01]
MKLINITNSNPQLVKEQLAHTDAHLVELYSLGRTTVIYTDAKTHSNLIILNKKRSIKTAEIDFVLSKLFKTDRNDSRLEFIHCNDFIEISLDK